MSLQGNSEIRVVLEQTGRGAFWRVSCLFCALACLEPVPEYYDKGTLATATGENLGEGFQVEKADCVRVRDIMTPVVFSVTPETPARKVVEDMLALKVHRLFVVSSDGVLIGVVSALDVLKHLGPGHALIRAAVPAPRQQAKPPGRQTGCAAVLTK